MPIRCPAHPAPFPSEEYPPVRRSVFEEDWHAYWTLVWRQVWYLLGSVVAAETFPG